MSIDLKPAQVLSFTEHFGAVQEVGFGFGWEVAKEDPLVVVNGVMLDKQKRIVEGAHDLSFVESERVQHDASAEETSTCDLLEFALDFQQIPPDVETLVFVANIVYADLTEHFGRIGNAYIRLVHKDSGREQMRFVCNNKSEGKTVMVLMRLMRDEQDWKIQALGQGRGSRLARLRIALSKIGVFLLIILLVVNAIKFNATHFCLSAVILIVLICSSIYWERAYIRSAVKTFSREAPQPKTLY